VTTVLSAIRQRPWVIMGLLLGAVMAVLGAPGLAAATANAASDDVKVEIVDDEADVDEVSFQQMVPDVVLVVPDGSNFDADLAALLSDLEAAPGVAAVWSDQAAGSRAHLLVSYEAERSDVGHASVESIVAAHPRGPLIAVGGHGATDRVLEARLGRSAFALVVLAAVVAGGLATWLARPYHGMVVGVSVALAGLLGATMGGRVAGPFDGSLVTTVLPGALAAVVVAVVLSFRLLSWFRDPVGEDLAEMIRRSVLSMGLELVLFFAGLLIVEIFLELVDPGRSVATVALVGALAATALTLAIVPPALSALHGVGMEANGEAPESQQSPHLMLRHLIESRPNGSDFPILVLLAFGFFFGFLSLLALGASTVSTLLDTAPVEEDRAVQEALRAAGGDPTAATLAVFPSGTDQRTKTDWLQRVSQLPSVGRVDTSVGRYIGGDLIKAEVSSVDPVTEGDEAPRFALVVSTVTARSGAARDLVTEIEGGNSPVNAELSGPSVDALVAAERDRSLVWATMIALAVMAGSTVFILVGDLTLAAMAAGLRLLDSMALVGLYQLLGGDVTGSELLVMVFIASIGIGLFEIGFLRHLLLNHRGSPSGDLISDALSGEGWDATAGLVVAGIGSLALISSGMGVLTKLGVLIMLGYGIEIVIGLWLLRPALLGTRTVTFLAARPVREALRIMNDSGGADQAEHQRWVSVVAGLLQSEFSFQADPMAADLEAVFQPGTPVYHSAAEQHGNLARAGLSVVGRPPQLRAMRVVTTKPTATVAVTVDHPPRRLINHDGAIVGKRKAERRSMMLWLVDEADGSYRIADLVETGIVALGEIEAPDKAVVPVVQAAME